MQQENRYSFFRIFWIILALYIFFTFLGIIAVSVAPVTDKSFNLNKLFTWHMLISQSFSIVFSTFFYYFTLNVFYRLLAERQKTIQFLRPIVLALISLMAYYAVSYFLISQKKIEFSVNGDRVHNETTTGLLIFSYTLSTCFFIGVSLLIAYLTTLRDEKKQRKILEAQKMQLEVEKSQANLNFLKAQINPHFLHNTLNFLYAKSLPYSPELSEGILTLSDIMRYALGEGSLVDGKAPLKDEVEHVRNVIKINQLRFSNNLNVHFEVHGVINGATIIPFVLITLVENAFKHGDLKSASHPINIDLYIDNKQLNFICTNKKKSGPKEISTGVGLDNIKKRLELAYGQNHRFIVKEDADFYTTELTITRL